MTVSAKGPGLASIAVNVRKLLRNDVLIGIPAENADRKPEKGETGPLNNAAIGYLMETGEPERNLPARPFLEPGIRVAEGKVVERLKVAAQAALIGDDGTIDQQFHAVGLIGQASVRAAITDGPHAPLSPRTLAQRRARGRTGTKPLIDTGQLRNSINYVVRPKGK